MTDTQSKRFRCKREFLCTHHQMVADQPAICQPTDLKHDGDTAVKRISVLMIIALGSTGCSSILHELQPHRLWRLNYQDPVGRTDGVYFSVDDIPDGAPAVSMDPARVPVPMAQPASAE